MAPCDLRDILRRTLRLVQPEMEKKKIVFSESYPDGALRLSADPEQLRQVFLNILLNAVAAVDAGGSISLKVDETAKDRKVYHAVTIRDSGTGMLPEEAANLFKPFYTTKAKGLGLGLHVTKKIVDDHDGSIEVDSKKGEGTSFRILLFKEKKA
jgi:signal transduction histidine kinase